MSTAIFALKLLDTALMVSEMVMEDRVEIEVGVEKLRVMIAEDRVPDEEDWKEVNHISDTLLAKLKVRVERSM
jgi:hypothetical protein